MVCPEEVKAFLPSNRRHMQTGFAEISVKGKVVTVPSFCIQRQTVVLSGTWLTTARIHDEEWMTGPLVDDPDLFIRSLQSASPRPDIFTFAQSVSETQPRYRYPMEWEDAAAVPITTYSDWWDGLPREARKNVRRAERRGVAIKLVAFDDALIQGIKGIYDETPIRQGRRFWHYRKDLESVKRDNSSFLDRSEFVGAYHDGELIGFIKLVYVDRVARIMQILSKQAHFDKRPPNALLAKAVEVCCQKGMTHFIYGRYSYGNKGLTPIAEFKRRNGFKRILFARYFVPMTLKGRAAVTLKLHHGLKNLLPGRVTNLLLAARGRFYERSLETSRWVNPPA
jgi:hypothetical protein